MRTLVLFILLWMSAWASFAQQARLFVTPDSVSIGDRVVYTVVMPPGGSYDSLALPDTSDFGPDMEMVELRLLRTPAQVDSLQFTLQYFGTDDLVLQGISVGVVTGGDTVHVAVPPVVIPFKTLLAEEEAEMRPYKDIFAFAISWTPYLLLALALILGGWVLTRVMRRYLKPPPRYEKIFIPRTFNNPLDDLERTLLSLRSDTTLIERDFKPFFTQLGDALRLYIEKVHHIPAMESTTRELLRDMGGLGVEPELGKQTGKVLRRADLVKFARFEPGLEQALESLRDGERFLQIARLSDQGKVNTMRSEFEKKVAEEEEAHRRAEARRRAAEEGANKEPEADQPETDQPETKEEVPA